MVTGAAIRRRTILKFDSWETHGSNGTVAGGFRPEAVVPCQSRNRVWLLALAQGTDEKSKPAIIGLFFI